MISLSRMRMGRPSSEEEGEKGKVSCFVFVCFLLSRGKGNFPDWVGLGKEGRKVGLPYSTTTAERKSMGCFRSSFTNERRRTKDVFIVVQKAPKQTWSKGQC